MLDRVGPIAPPAAAGQAGANPWIGRLGVLSGLALIVALVMIFFVAPTELVQGDAQRIFYAHVPLALNAGLAFFVTFVGSILYLWKRRPVFDVWARSAAEIGVVLTTLVLITGSIWARPIWGTWWTWDARLTTTLILWLIYVGYLVVRASIGDPGRAARYAAVIGIIGFIDVPIIRQSVVWWRTLHPGPTVVQETGSIGLPTSMLIVFLVALAAVTLFHVYLLLVKVRIEQAKDDLRARRVALLD